MYLHITNEAKLDLDAFCKWLIPNMKQYLQINIDEKKLIRFNDYINNNIRINNLNTSGYPLNPYNILVKSADYLVVKKLNNQYIIALDETAYIPNTQIHIIDIIKLINYGNIELVAYPIYNELMEWFADNITVLYNRYIEED